MKEEPMLVIPTRICLYNACSDRCDMINFLCACGSVHDIQEIKDKMKKHSFPTEAFELLEKETKNAT